MTELKSAARILYPLNCGLHHLTTLLLERASKEDSD
jgi:hypothetical protein